MSRRRRLSRIGETFAATLSDYRVENPSLFPAWVWMRPPDAYGAPRKRGGPLFAEMDRLVPQPGWAADLAAVNPNVFLLPDYTDATADRFGVRLTEVAQASAKIKKARQAARREMGL